ncbi:branched-chain amino acid ABC transporter permease [Pseudomonas sp. Z18(2022)]|uniref:branched-chain amino acid ABC transporter permease n=1 Tax=Pseudomonas sp. Z18(2022) TaxID=2983410 RepID=UPI002E80708C|nr:branched-chain amino acid ABC transporter permease [Pseudomonas sp. Z18(2022)]
MMTHTLQNHAVTRPADSRQALKWLAFGALALLLVFVPEVLSAYWLRVATTAAIYTLAAASLSLLYARLGLVSLAQVALVGVGGWVSLRVAHSGHWPYELSLLAGGIAAGITGMLVGLPALRLRGLYLALITLMAAAGFSVLITAVQFPNGGEGLRGFNPAGGMLMARPWLGQSDIGMFRYCVIVAGLGFLLIEWHQRSRPGRAWALIRKGEACAMAAGINVSLYKSWAFCLAGFLAGIAGALLAASLGTLDARSFPASESIMLAALSIVGGAYSILGAIITGVLYRVFPAFLDNLGLAGDLSYVIFGIALLHTLITAPQGIAGQLLAQLRHWRARP